MNHDFYYKLISGQKKGFTTAFLKTLLAIIACIYSIIIKLRNLLYDVKVFKTYQHETTVISIGNITTGGTGKTPLVIWLYNFLAERNVKCAILTRGYKADKKSNSSQIESGKTTSISYTDEPAILSESCPKSKVIVNPDRVAGASEAIEKFAPEVLILDDGFQHRRLARDLDIITIDATQPFGYNKILPAGLLREPLNSLKRANAIVLTRCDQIPAPELNRIENKLQAVNPDMIITRSVHKVAGVKTTDGESINNENLKGKKIFAFCGIGNPNAFLNTIKTLGAELTGTKIFNDHYQYTDTCLSEIYELAGLSKAELILTTQKDWTKIRHFKPQIKDLPLTYIIIEIKFLAGEDKLRLLIDNVLAGKIMKR